MCPISGRTRELESWDCKESRDTLIVFEGEELLDYVRDLVMDDVSVCNHYHWGPFWIPARILLRALRRERFTFVLGMDHNLDVHLFTEDSAAGAVLDPNYRLGPVEAHTQLVMNLGS